MFWQDTEQELLWRSLWRDEEIMLLLTSLRDRRNAGNQKYFLMLISQRSGSKDNVIIADSEIWNGLSYKEAEKAIEELEKLNQGYGKRITVCVMLFSRQRYWENRSRYIM
jgi:hypothetical protein